MAPRRTTPRRVAVELTAALLRIPFRIANRFRQRRIVVFSVWPDFERIGDAIADSLRRHGFDVERRTGRSFLDRIRISASRDLWIGFWNEFRTDSAPRQYIFCNGEQLSLPHWSGDPNWTNGIRNALEVWDYSQANEPYVRSLGGSYRYVPIGYAPSYEATFRQNTDGNEVIEDIDVLFVGQMTDRRRRVLDELRYRGVALHEVTRANPAHGAALDRLLSRSKIVLSVFSYDDPAGHLADFARLAYLLANRRFAVQERPSATGADAALEREVTTCSYDALADTCVAMLAAPAERKRIAESAYQWFKSERALDDFIPFDAVREYLARQ